MKRILIVLFMFFSYSLFANERDTVVGVPYGDMELWIQRSVTDSKILGGFTHIMHEVSGGVDIGNNMPYKKAVFVPWASSNTFADVGVVKGSSTVLKDVRGDGYCAKLVTKLEVVNVLRLFNINVIAAGTLFFGSRTEPLSSASDGIRLINRGIETKVSPESVIFDYKYHSAGERYYADGVGAPELVGGKNVGEVIVFLQKRWEDEDGNIFAKRLATAIIQLDDTNGEWINDFELPLFYGNITDKDIYNTSTYLLNDDTPEDLVHYTTNSKGEQTRIIEIGFGDKSDKPTHVFMSFSSSQTGAFIGAPGSVLWLDNVKTRIKNIAVQ